MAAEQSRRSDAGDGGGGGAGHFSLLWKLLLLFTILMFGRGGKGLVKGL